MQVTPRTGNASATIANNPGTVASTTGSQAASAMMISSAAAANIPVTSAATNVSQMGRAVTVSTTTVTSSPVYSVPGDFPGCSSGSTSASIYVTPMFNAQQQLDTLAQLLPGTPPVQLKFLMEVGKGEADAI